jgi:hypothetical protein
MLLVLILTVFSAGVFAQERQFTIDGEAKTGFIWYKNEDGLNDAEEDIIMGNKDDAGNFQGRFRLNMEYLNESGFMGFKVRLNFESWGQTNIRIPQEIPYAFGYGNFFEDQLTLSVGILGSSPWGTGGPEMWKELEKSGGGMRFEYKPFFAPGLNAGVVFNYFDFPREAAGETDITFWEILRESVLGISYTHELFMARFAYRLDSEMDQRIRGAKDGDDLLYRIEERAIQNYLPGFQVWALGYANGLGTPDFFMENWIFAEYAPDLFTAQIRLGMDFYETRTELKVRPNFYWNFFDSLLVVGVMFQYSQDFGEGKMHPGSPFYNMMVEPKVQVNFSPNAYFAFAYNWERIYVREFPIHIEQGVDPIHQKQWINLRMGMRF